MDKPKTILQLEKELGIDIPHEIKEKFFYQTKGVHGHYRTNTEGNIIALNFYRLPEGRIPESVCELTQLEELTVLHSNVAQIPESIAKLERLVKLKLNFNRLTWLPVLPKKLRSIELLENDFSSFPKEIAELNELEHISLESNKITSFPEELLSLKALNSANLRKNLIESLPQSATESNIPVKIQYRRERGIYMQGNPLTDPPIGLLKYAPQATKLYFNKIQVGAPFRASDYYLFIIRAFFMKLFGVK